VAWNAGISPSLLLLPLSVGALLGGLLTLIGTAPNIVVANQLAAAGSRRSASSTSRRSAS
jgi:Na+/H+ antiporter NhaD/arsenite permease-like protein